MKTIQALYTHWEAADEAIEKLLDRGFSHTDISLMSADHWYDEGSALFEPAHSRAGRPGASGVAIEIKAFRDEMIENALEVIYRSRPLKIRELVYEWESGWAILALPIVIDRS